MTGPAFAETGLMVRARADQTVRRFQVLGERSSGTNLAKRLLARNSGLTPCEDLGWKHGFPQAMAIPADIAVIGIVRRADSWALSMHAKPWHCTPEMQGLTFSEFLRAAWETRIDRARYFEGARAAGTVGQILQQDRHPVTGAAFSNLFQLRRAKLDGLLGYAARGCSFALVRLETLTAEPEATIRALSRALAAPSEAEAFRPVHKRLGARFLPAISERPDTPEALSDDDMDFLRSQIDAQQEAWLGYSY